MANLADAYISIVPSFKGFKKAVNDEMRGLETEGKKHGDALGKATADSADKGFKGASLGDKLSKAMGKTLKAGAIGAGAAAGGVMAAAFTKGFGRLSALDQAKKKMEGLKLSSDDVSRAMDGVNASVKGTAFGLDEAAGSAAKFIGVGIQVGNELDRSMKLTADIAAQAGTSMDDISSIVAKIAGAGKLTGETLAQLDDRAVGAAGALSKHLGVSIDEVREKISKGEIDFETFSKAMEEHVGGAALKTGETVKGAMDNMMSALGRIGATMLTPLFDAAPEMLRGFTDVFDAVNEALKPAAERISASLTPALERVGETISAKVAPAAGVAAEKLGDLVAKFVDKAVDPGVWEKVGNAFDFLGRAAMAAGGPVLSLIEVMLKITGAISVEVWGALLNVIEALAPVLNNVLVPALESVASFIQEHPSLVGAMVTAWMGMRVLSTLTSPLRGVASALLSVVRIFAIAKFAQEMATIAKAVGATNPAMAAFARMAGRVATAFNPLGRVLQIIVSPLRGLISLFMTGIRALNPWVAVITAVVGALTWFFTKTEAGQRIWQSFMDLLKQAAEWLRGAFAPVFDFIGEKITSAFEGIKSVAGGALDFVRGKITGFVDGVKSAFSGVLDFFRGGETVDLAAALGVADDSLIIAAFERVRGAVEMMRDGVTAAWDWMKAKWEELTIGIGQFYETWVAPVWELFQTAAQALRDFTGEAFDWIKAKWEELAQGLQQLYETWIAPVWELFTSAVSALWEFLQPIFAGIGTGFQVMGTVIQSVWNSLIRPVWDAFKQGAQLLWQGTQTVWQLIGLGFQTMGRIIKSVWDNIIRPVFGFFRQAAGLLADVLTGNFDNIKNRFEAMGHHLGTIVRGPINVAMETFKAIIDGVKRAFTILKDHAGRMMNAVKSKITEMVNTIKRVPQQVKSAFSNAGQWLVQAGKDVIQGFINGIKSMAGAVGNAISSVIPHSIGGLVGFSGGGAVPAFARGGVLPDVPGIPRSVRDPILGVSKDRKIPVARVEPGEFIVNRKSTAKHLPLLRAINGGELEGKPRADGLPAYAGGGIVGAMTSLVKQKFPMLTMTSGYRSGDAGFHGRGMAADFSNGSGNTPQQLALARAIAQTYPNSAELIYDSPGWSGNIKNGKNVGAFGSYYTMAQAGPHHHHVHWAMTTAPTRPLGSGPASGGSNGSGPAPVQHLGPSKWSEKMLTVNAVRAMRALQVKFPQIKMIGGWRANDPYPDHPSGRALDIMTYNDMGLGDRVKDWLFNNDFKMQYALWRQAQWNSASARQGMANRGSPTQNHMDHVHAYFAPSPRATGNEKYTMPAGAGGGVVGAAGTGDMNSPQQKEKRTIQQDQIDYGTASQLKTEFESRDHHETSLRKYLQRRAKVYDTGGLFRPGDIAVNMGKPEVIFPAEALTAMLKTMRHTPQYVAAMDMLSKHVPPLAAAIDKWTGLDYGKIEKEITGAFNNAKLDSKELGKAIGEPMAEKLIVKLAFIGDQIRDIQKGGNINSYLFNLRAAEGVALTDQIASVFGIGGINDTFGGVAKGFNNLEDAAVAQQDAIDAVTQAEKNLARVRKEAAAINGDGSPEEKEEAKKAVADAESELKKARGTVSAASAAIGQAQVAMMIEIAEMVVKIIQLVDKRVQEVFAGFVSAWKGVGEMVAAAGEFYELAEDARSAVAGLRIDWAMAQIELAAAFRNLRIAQADGMKGQLEAARSIAEAEAAFEQARRNDLRLSMAQYEDLSLAYDRFRWSAKEAIEGNLADMSLWSEETKALYEELNAARVGLDLARAKGQEKELEAVYKLALAALDLDDVTRDLRAGTEKLAVMTGKAFGFDQVEATVGERYANLVAEKAQLNAQQASIKTWGNFANWWSVMPENQRRIRQIDEELKALESRPEFKAFDQGIKKQVDSYAAKAGAMGFFGAGDNVAGMIKNSELGDAARALDAVKFENELIDLRSEQAKTRAKLERDLLEIEHRQKLDPVKTQIDALEMRQGSHEAMADYYRSDSPVVREAILALAKQQRDAANDIERLSKPVVVQVPGDRTALTVDEVQGILSAISSEVGDVSIRVDRMERAGKPDALAVSTGRRF